MKISSELIKVYKDSYFFINNEIGFNFFAVITAWNPFSMPLSNIDNHRANNELISDILKQNYEKIVVGDINKKWTEDSIAVHITQQEAVALGRKYKQNAVYFIEKNELFLVSCVEEDKSKAEYIGRFSDRVINTGDKSE